MGLTPSAFLGERTVRLDAAGGVAIQGSAQISVCAGERLMAVKLALDPGFFHPWHNHPDHESMGVVLVGRLEMQIGDRLVQLGPGDTWHHPQGVYHSTRALESTLAVEFHTPLRAELLRLFDAQGETP